MKILTNRNGIALVAVLALLLVLTLLVPTMFTMAERATKDAYTEQDKQRASYLARTMIEMSVAAFQDQYDAAEDEQEESDFDPTATNTVTYKLDSFYNSESKEMNAATLYMYQNEDVQRPLLSDYDGNESDPAYITAIDRYKRIGAFYSTDAPDGNGYRTFTETLYDSDGNVTGTADWKNCKFVGKADCKITYDDSTEYYKTTFNSTALSYETVKITKDEYDAGDKTSTDETAPQYSKLEKRNVVFISSANVNGKYANRRCVVYLPTKPAEQNWIVPAKLESNQIFVDSSKATSTKNLKIPASFFVDSSAVKEQKMFFFSCIGNMVITSEGMTIKNENNVYVDSSGVAPEYAPYDEYVNAYNNGKEPKDQIVNQLADFSLGVHPITTTRDPENDPNFACVKTNNMSSWAKSGQKDNFVGFTATQGIQVDMPINLLINPCRTMRIGDGIDPNQSLYKMLYFQAPTIVFNESVNSFVSLYQKYPALTLAGSNPYDAFRMSSIILAAPQSTPYSYYHSTYKKTVTAGMVYFMEDAYVWVVPFTENGSNKSTQTVYYKGKDIILYKFASAGDVYMFNNEVKSTMPKKSADGTTANETYNAGFSITNYFMDVLYNEEDVGTQDKKWYQIWGKMKENIYSFVSEETRQENYVKEDLKYIGNVKSGGLRSTPVIDDFYVVWDS